VSPAGLAAHCLALLGPTAGPVVVAGPRAARVAAALARTVTVAAEGAAAVVVFLAAPADAGLRRAVLDDLRRRLPPGAPVVLVDHNQPRAWWRRTVAIAAALVAGRVPTRARYPAARELAAAGFAVERLRLAPGERLQFVVARR
jgi:hypothetical protein